MFISVLIYNLNPPQNQLVFKGADLTGEIGLNKTDSKYINNSEKHGFLTYGPYVTLESGTHFFSLTYSSDKVSNARFEIATNDGKDTVKKATLQSSAVYATISHKIVAESNQSNQKWEARVWYAGAGELSVHKLLIEKRFGLKESKKLFQYFILTFIPAFLLIFLFFTLYRYSKIATLFSLLLIILVGLSFVIDAYTDYYKYKEMTYKQMPLNKDIFKYYLEESIKSEYVKQTAPDLTNDKNIDSFYIMIDKQELNLLNSDLPSSGMENYVDAHLKINNSQTTKVKIRYRGGSAWNWEYNRKSLKIKFKDNDSYNMMKTINFSVLYSLDMSIEPITQKIASSVGALAPVVKTVRMFINGEYSGLYLYSDQVDESFLRKNHLMPGSIYNGDYSPREPWSNYVGKDGIAKLWFDSQIWEKKSARNAEQKKNREDINLLIKAINQYSDLDFYNFANTYLSEAYYTYIALDVLWGTHHHDYFHNHKIYFDPYRGKYTPISWDIRFWRADKNKDNSYYPLIQRLALNPLLEYKRDKELHRLLQIINPAYIDILMNEEKDKILHSFMSDNKRKKISINKKLFPWRETRNPPQLKVAFQKDLDKVFNLYSANLKERLKYLNNMLEDIEVKYSTKVQNGKATVTVSVDGNSPVKLNYKEKVLYPGRKILNTNALNLDSAGYGKTQLKNIPQFYTFSFDSDNFDEKIFKGGTNAITGKKVIFSKMDKIDIAETDSIHSNKFKQPKFKVKTLKGTVQVQQTLIFDKYTEVIIEPDTTFIMDENRSIYFYGKVAAIGTKEKPIKFMAKDKTKPWGLVAVQGKSTTGSKFHFCEFENGSIDTRNLIHYTSQFNIHDMDYFEVKNCKIGRNFVGDDAMHIAYAKGIVDNCIFDAARSDGLDIDISDVTITNNIFKNSGNDGLDVMTTTMSASNNTFVDTGDKGISVGEWSTATITDSTFTRTLIGLEIKDKSKVIANNLTFIDSKEKAINLYNKNKRYDTGGFLEATSIIFVGNSTVKADKKSEVIINE